jgi:hypothetical protein
MTTARRICIVTHHPFWREPLGCGTLMRGRYNMLKTLCGNVFVVYISPGQDQCPLDNSTTIALNNTQPAQLVNQLQQIVARHQIDTCYFSYLKFAAVAAHLNCRKVVEIHDVLHIRNEAFATFGFKAPSLISKDQELAALKLFDRVMSLNLQEVEYLHSHGLRHSCYLPPFIPCEVLPQAVDTPGLLGSLAVPNIDGLEQIQGLLGDLPKALVAGPLARSDLAQKLPETVQNLGVLKTPRTFYEHVGLVLSPIRFGGGLKIKVFEALAHGRPVLATEHSIEGFPDGIRDVVTVEEPALVWTSAHCQRALQTPTDDIRHYFLSHFSESQCYKALANALN